MSAIKQQEEEYSLLEATVASAPSEAPQTLLRLTNTLAGLRSQLRATVTAYRKNVATQQERRDSFYRNLQVEALQNEIKRVREAPFIKFMKEVVPALIQLTPDSERQSSLHLRYCLAYPAVESLCCRHVHCFRCKTQGTHPGEAQISDRPRTLTH